jgi:hypothetical protein
MEVTESVKQAELTKVLIEVYSTGPMVFWQPTRGEQKKMGESLKVVRAEFSTLS